MLAIRPGSDLDQVLAAGSAVARLADADGAAVDVVAVHGGHSVLRRAVVRKFDEAEAAGATGVAVEHDVDVVDGVTASLKGLAKSIGGRFPREVPDEEA